MNLHFRVESAFEELIDALHMAIDHAEPGEEQKIYRILTDDVIDARGKAQDDLLLYLVKKNAAPAAGTTETANDSGKESIFSLDEKTEDVKRSALTLTVIDDETVEAELKINGPSKHLLNLLSAAVEAVVFAAPDLWLDPEDLEKAYNRGMDRGMKRLVEKSKDMLSELGESSRNALLRLAKELNVLDEFISKITGGAGK